MTAVPQDKTSKLKFKFGDFIFLGIFVAVIITFFCVIFKPGAKDKHQLIIESGKDKWIYQLDKDGKYEIPGKLGNSIIEVKDGKAVFAESPCENKICVFSKAISKNGEWTACLPNGVIIRIEGSADDELDAVVR